jgi:hypothetical protein
MHVGGICLGVVWCHHGAQHNVRVALHLGMMPQYLGVPNTPEKHHRLSIRIDGLANYAIDD